MNINELTDHVSERQGITKSIAREIIDTIVTAVAEAATKGDEVSLPGFGKFKVTSRAAREGRNPATGATIKIAASKKVSFVPAKALKDALNSAPGKKAAKAGK
jgi:DNA-binding protein HU-beta